MALRRQLSVNHDSVPEALAHGHSEWHSRSFISISIPENRRSYLPAMSTIRLWMAAIWALPPPYYRVPLSSFVKPELNWSAGHHALLHTQSVLVQRQTQF